MVKTHPELHNTFLVGARARPPRLSVQHHTVLEFFRSIYPNGATDKEMEDHFGKSGQLSGMFRKRRSDLTTYNLVHDTGQTKGTGRHKSIVWAAAPWEQEPKQGEH